MSQPNWPFEPDVRKVASLLVRGEYHRLERLTGGERLSASELAQALGDYGGTLCEPPSPAAAPLEVTAHKQPNARSWSVVLPLWTIEEGCSDLSLELTVREIEDGAFAVEIDDLHVL